MSPWFSNWSDVGFVHNYTISSMHFETEFAVLIKTGLVQFCGKMEGLIKLHYNLKKKA